ncbi:MAG: DUF1499 domain-containing protein [Hyphomicrobiaceae bacterium]|nr:DUF1499 domain-containing protein [Hyphomicrobiaceae bacterium]
MRLQMLGPVVSAVALGAGLCLLALAPLGSQLGWWSYSVSLYRLFPASGLVGAAAAALSLATLALGRSKHGPRTLVVLGVTLAAGMGLVWLPLQYAYVRRTLPPIHDIATDTVDRPAFRATEAARAQESANRIDTDEPQLSQLQRAAYPDVAPVYARLPIDEAFHRALERAQTMPGWMIVDAQEDDGRIEASQRSRWFGFTDDIVIRVRPADGGARIDIRSASRKGRHDYGVNAARIRAYLSALKRTLGERP